MNKKKSQDFNSIIRLIALIGSSILILGLIKDLVVYGLEVTNWSFLLIRKNITNLFAIIFFIITFLNPKKVEFLAIISFSYTVICTIEENYYNVMGLFMYFLSISLLIYRGFYHQKKLLKIIISAIILMGLYMTKLRFGIYNFINSLFQCAGYSIVFFSSIFFLSKYQSRKYKSNIQSKILDLSNYDENQLSAIDKEWLELALSNEKYEAIARRYGYSEGHVKNKMRYIFSTIDVIDRIDLFSKYAGCKVIKNKEELQKWKQDVLDSID